MKTRWLWALPLVALTVVACSTSPDTGTSPATTIAQTGVTTNVTSTAETTPEQSPDPTAPVNSPKPETPGAQPGLQPASPRYERIPRNYFTVPDPSSGGQVAFSSPDGSIRCEFRPMEDNPPLNMEPTGNWRLGFAQGACQWGDQQQPEYVVADSNPENRPGFAEQQSWISHAMPDYYTPLFEGNYLDLHTMGCFTERADEISCLKYQTGEGFTINSAGYQRLDAGGSADLLDTGDGVMQVLSPTPVFSLADGQELACFHEPPDNTQFFCQTLGPSLWGESHNLVHFRLLEDRVELIGSTGANPGFDVYLARQPVGTSKALVDDHLTVNNDGTRLTFLTRNGEEFWVSADAFGVGG